MMARVDEIAMKYGNINFLVRLETDMDNYSVAALIKYFKVSFEHFSRWNRMAIVSDETRVRVVYDALSPMVPGEIRAYKLAEYEAAKQWVSAPLTENENRINNQL